MLISATSCLAVLDRPAAAHRLAPRREPDTHAAPGPPPLLRVHIVFRSLPAHPVHNPAGSAPGSPAVRSARRPSAVPTRPDLLADTAVQNEWCGNAWPTRRMTRSRVSRLGSLIPVDQLRRGGPPRRPRAGDRPANGHGSTIANTERIRAGHQPDPRPRPREKPWLTTAAR